MKITNFKGNEEPFRPISKKISDLVKIEEETERLRKANNKLQEQINNLEQRKTSLVQCLQNVEGANKPDIEEKLADIDQKILQLKAEIEENKELCLDINYGYRERL